MMSKIKSAKIANVKILIGFILAASLVAIFACEQKKSKKTEVAFVGNTVTIVTEGNMLTILGDTTAIKKLIAAINTSDDYELQSDRTSHLLKLVNKSGKTDEPVGVGFGIKKKSAKVQEEVYNVVEQMPEFSGGESALRAYLGKEIKYPAEAVKKGIQGKVFVTFVTAKDGSVSNAKIVRGVDPLIDAEALRVVNAMPKWTPGKQSGKDVAVQFTVPINFVLQ